MLPRRTEKSRTLERMVLVAALSTAGIVSVTCLVTSPPEFNAPAATPPYFLPEDASPGPGQVIVLDYADASDLVLRAELTSQDDPSPGSVFDHVSVRLFLDGEVVSDGTSAKSNSLGNAVPVSATLPKEVWVGPNGWRRLALGCHRITLMASHQFSPANPNCPTVCGDMGATTWLAMACDSTNPGSDDGGPCSSLTLGTCTAPLPACPATPVVIDGGPSCTAWNNALR